MAALVLFLNLTQTIAITSFSILSAQVVLNYSAIKLRGKNPNPRTFKTPMYPLIPLLGLVSSIVLMFSLPEVSWIVALVVSIVASAYYLIRKRFRNLRGN